MAGMADQFQTADELAEIHMGLIIKLMSLAVHAEEFIETGESLDAAAIQGLLNDPEIVRTRENLDRVALLPVKRG